MPIYEYECEACSHRFDTLQKFSDAALTKCPECKKESLRKLISAAAFRLKGEGWYETDFKSGKKKNIAGGESSDSSEKSAAKSGDTNKSGTKSESSKSESKGKSDSKSSSKNSSTNNKASRG